MANNKGQVGVFKVAATYIGTIVGAGFASGQEVYQFFSTFGLAGIWSIIISTAFFIFFGYTVLILGMKLNANSHIEIIRFSSGKIVGTFIDIVITIFLFGALAAMIAGAGAIFKEQFHLSPLLGTLVMAGITLITVLTGIKGVINAISYVVPILLGSVFFIVGYSLFTNPISTADINHSLTLQGAAPHWLISAVNYASYNLVIAIAVLGPLGTQVKEKRTLFLGALFGGLGLGLGILGIYFSILTHITEVSGLEIPLILIASKVSPLFQILFSIVLFAEVYTTAVGSMFGFVRRINLQPSRRMKILSVVTAVLAFGASQFGFSNMVKYLYPAVGYGGMVMLISLLGVWILRRKELNF